MPQTLSKSDVVTAFRRRQIFDAARQCFLSGGFKATTMEQVATAAGVAKGTLYLYFPSKDAVLHQILQDDLTELREQTLPPIQAEASTSTRLRAFFRAMVEFYETHRDFIDLCQSELGQEFRKSARRQLQDIFQEQEDAWADVLKANGVKPGVARAHGRTLAILGHGLAVQRMRGWLAGPVEREIEAAVQLALNGVVPK